MAKESNPSPADEAGLDRLAASVGPGDAAPVRPVHRWNPPFCGDIDMRIARDGTWFYAGTPIGRPALVKLFASVLRHDPDGYMLVTPVEKVRITVEDAPFVAVELAAGCEPEPLLRLRTSLDEWVAVDADHPLRFAPGAADGLKPYVRVRDGLEALLGRAVFLELAERGTVRTIEGTPMFGVASGPLFFPMARAADLEGLL